MDDIGCLGRRVGDIGFLVGDGVFVVVTVMVTGWREEAWVGEGVRGKFRAWGCVGGLWGFRWVLWLFSVFFCFEFAVKSG